MKVREGAVEGVDDPADVPLKPPLVPVHRGHEVDVAGLQLGRPLQ